MKKIAILQSNYIPWKGYFDLINSVDEFVLYDDMQYTKNDWRNRNKIKTPQGVQWLTIPVTRKSLGQKIKDTQVSDPSWRNKHWKTICQNYGKAKYFSTYAPLFESLYLNDSSPYLSEINKNFILAINSMLGIHTRIRHSSEFTLAEGKTQRLVDICRALDANEYLSGPAAKDYLDEGLFLQAGITVKWMNYNGYPEYNQFHSPFEHGVTVLDLICNEGVNASHFMKSFNHQGGRPGHDVHQQWTTAQQAV